jgi:hypothetical protein
VDIRLIEFYNNLKNWNFDIKLSYSVDENEAKKIMQAIEDMQEEIDKLHDIVNKIGKNANNKGNLYYAVLEFINKYGTHSTGDYFKFKAESEGNT